MDGMVGAVRKFSGWMNGLAGIVLFLMMMLTVVDVGLRIFWKPITGTYELVAMAGAVVIGFAIPQTSWDNAHIFVDFLIENRSRAVKIAFGCFNRLMGIILFVIARLVPFHEGEPPFQERGCIPHAPDPLLSRGVWTGILCICPGPGAAAQYGYPVQEW